MFHVKLTVLYSESNFNFIKTIIWTYNTAAPQIILEANWSGPESDSRFKNHIKARSLKCCSFICANDALNYAVFSVSGRYGVETSFHQRVRLFKGEYTLILDFLEMELALKKYSTNISPLVLGWCISFDKLSALC